MAHGSKRRNRRNRSAATPKPVTKHLGGHKGRVTAVREEKDGRGQVTNLVLEERFDVPVPPAIKNRVRCIFVKRNSEAFDAGHKAYVDKVRSYVVVIVFRADQQITGLPVSAGKARKLAKTSFTHVTIEGVPEEKRREAGKPPDFGEYDERRFRITWWKPKSGHKRNGQKGGEAVFSLTDELAVLQWLYENDLQSLYELRVLTSWEFLPVTDEERERQNAITAQMQMAFGHLFSRPHEDRVFHRTRLLSRLYKLHDGGKERSLGAFARTAIGRRARSQIDSGTFASQAFYFSRELQVAYGIWNLPEARYIMCVDLKAKKALLEPIKVDAHGLDLMTAYHNCLTNEKFVAVEWQMFQNIISGIGTMNQQPIALAN